MYPALTVLQTLQADIKDAGMKPDEELEIHPFSVLWVGGEGGMEADLVKRAGVPFTAIPAAGVHGVGLRALPRNLARLARGFLASRRVLHTFRPDVLLFTGGYVAVPLALAARLPERGLPRPRSLVYIPDIELGLALKALIRFADVIAVTCEPTRSFLPARKVVSVTGYPVRPGLKAWDRSRGCQALGLNSDIPTLLVSGGSRGSRSINRALLEALPHLLPDMQVVHITGQLDWPEVEKARQALPAGLSERYHPYPYLHEEMGAALAAADLAVSRAGASTLGEYPLFGLPAILVPYPYAWRYQRTNAQYLVDHGAAVVLNDADLGDRLLPMIQQLMQDAPGRAKMKRSMQSLAHPEAAGSIAALLSGAMPGIEHKGRGEWSA